MHDDQLERRLRATLRDEADRMPFTIAAAELERRMVLRGRGAGNRRLGLLLAATVGIGLVGLGGVIAGLTRQPAPSPVVPSPIAQATSPNATAQPASTPNDGLLPSLEDLIAAAGADPVVIAQAHGPADGPDPQLAQLDLGGSGVSLGDIAGSTGYVLAYGCLGEGEIQLDVRVPFSRGPRSGPTAACDGAMHEELIGANGPRSFSLVTTESASWRVLVRRLDGAAPTSPTETTGLRPGDGEEALIDQQRMMVQPGGPDATDRCCRSGTLLRQEIGAMPGRFAYQVQLWCTGGEAIRYFHGDDIDGQFVARTTTHVACDGVAHAISLGIPEPYGSRVFVAATAETMWSVLVSSELPPVALVDDLAGYQLAGGAGPSYAFETQGYSFSGIGGEDAGPIVVALDCTGTEAIEVSVVLGPPAESRIETFLAKCTPEGQLTTETFAAGGPDVSVSYDAPQGSWSAMTILVPVSSP